MVVNPMPRERLIKLAATGALVLGLAVAVKLLSVVPAELPKRSSGSATYQGVMAAADKEAARINGPTPIGMVGIGRTARAKGHTWLCPRQAQINAILRMLVANKSVDEIAKYGRLASCITVDDDPYLNIEKISQSDQLECAVVPGEDNGPEGCLWTPAWSIEDRGE